MQQKKASSSVTLALNDARLTPRSIYRLLALLLVCSLLLVMTVQQYEDFAPVFSDFKESQNPAGSDNIGLHIGRSIRDLWDSNSSDVGRYAGRALSDMWADNLPEQAWFSDPQCRHLVTRFTCRHCLPLVYLASFPRSGNTWARYLLEASTGIFTSSGGPSYHHYQLPEYRNLNFTDARIWAVANASSELVKMGYYGEYVPWTEGNTIVQKSHEQPEPWNKTAAEDMPPKSSPFPENAFRKAVLLVRNPFKSFISLEKYSQTKSVLNDEDMRELFKGEEWRDFVLYYSQYWYDLNAQWIEATNTTHVIAYERLTQDPVGELTKLLRFLDIEPDARRLECVRRHLEGKVHNQHHGVVPDHETYPLRQRAEVWSHIHQLNWLLKDRGYEPLPLDKYSFFEEFGDIYVGS